MKRIYACSPLLLALLLAACGTTPTTTTTPRIPPPAKSSIREPGMPVLPPANSGRGGYYLDDGPGENPPPGLMDVPDAEVRLDPLLPRSNKPYTVFGKTYTPTPMDQPYTVRGLGTWYGKKFHGQRTSSGEIYDMYKMTAAHPTLPIPSYARVTNMSNGKTVVVRINDRGPFHSTRVIDVSFTAALKLGLLANGSSELEVVHLLPSDIEQIIAARKSGSASPVTSTGAAAPADSAPATTSASSRAVPLPKAAPMLASGGAPADVEAMMLGGGNGVAPDSANVQRTGGTAAAALDSGFYLQLGAYTRAEAADAMRDKLSAADAEDNFTVVQAGSVYRLYGGPHATRKDAQDAVKRIPSALRLKPIIIQR
ncbi:septal ring lytic transglycosylase RlpA family protein [Pseudoduganella sp. RAF53_2]|uniref:septal ring lytic transglycosylase RlpA family protein n=1 Tax=unclassified Pseudoduganella TaxID=2637179 RepID=UPI003F9AD48B